MSFILDALKKSETDRQQRSTAEFSKVPSSSGPARAPGWLLALGILLLINLGVLLGVLLRSSPEPAGPRPAVFSDGGVLQTPESRIVDEGAPRAEQNEPSFVDRVAEAKHNAALPRESGATVAPETGATSLLEPTVAKKAPPPSTALLPTIYEVIADGSIVLPELHLDIHVYSEVPADRFVFINMSKQRENSQLSEGPLVEEITPDGVILGYRGKSFLLPRD
jgi:general secretion pathway protein B